VREHWDTGRTEAFSDGVFAIAITLLVLEISVPESAFADLWSGIADEWPSYLGYATSFLTIGGIWLAHHGIFSRLQYVDARVIRLNLLLLMAVSFLPFPTKLVAEAITDEDAARAAVLFYGTALFATSVLLAAVWGAVARNRELVRTGVSDEEIAALVKAATPSLSSYVVVIAVGIFFPQLAAFGFLAIAVLLVLRARGERSPLLEAKS
jgi:uncharacterized membrane protein